MASFVVIDLRNMLLFYNIKPYYFFVKIFRPTETFLPEAANCIFKVTYSNTRKRCEICLKLAIKTPERH